MVGVSTGKILDRNSLTLEHRVTAVMVSLSFLFLVIVAAILPQATPTWAEGLQSGTLRLYVLALLALWVLFFVEFMVQALVFRSFTHWKRGAQAFGAALVPPLRIAVRPGATPGHLWIPFLGWQRPDKALSRRIEKRFSVPMMMVALMILPMLGLEFIWTSQLESNPWLWSAVDIGTRIIWLAFAVEFLIMVSVSKKPVAYCKNHWIDLAIILLPLISFLRVLRLLRLGRLAKIQKMSRVYRLRGLTFRVLRAIMILRVLDRASHRFAQKRLEHLRAKVNAKRAEIEELHEEIEELGAYILKMRKEREALDPAKPAAEASD